MKKVLLLLFATFITVCGCNNTLTGPVSTPEERIFFTELIYSGSTAGAKLYSVKPDASDKQLLNNAAIIPCSPQMGRILFFNGDSITSGLYVSNLEGKNVGKILVDINNSFTYPALSHNATRIAFPANRQPGMMYAANLDGSNPTSLAAASETQPVFSPDGKKIAFYSNQNRSIVVINANGTGLKIIAYDPASEPKGNSVLDWSVQNQIVFMSKNDSLGHPNISVINSDGSGRQDLTKDKGDSIISVMAPKWSPDGKKIAFTQNGGLWLMNADGTEKINLTHGASYKEPDSFVQWSSDGNNIVYCSYSIIRYDSGKTNNGQTGDLKIMNLVTKTVTVLAHNVYKGFWAR